MCLKGKQCTRDLAINHIHTPMNKGMHTMKNTKRIELNQPAENQVDPLTELLRDGAKQLIKEAVEQEIQNFIDPFRSLKTKDGKQKGVRNGYLSTRKIVTGIGEVEVQFPRSRVREDLDSILN